MLALLAGLLIGRVRRDPFLEITATTVLAYLSFYVAEHNLHLSGVMAIVAAGVLIGGCGQTKISASVANALIFLLVGLTVDLASLLEALPTLAWVVVAMLVSRALVIYTLVPLSSRLTGSEPVSGAYRTVMFWGGLRGGIALAIALSLPESFAAKEDFVTIATGAVLFTLVVQGLTIERVVKHFRPHVPPLSDRLAGIEGRIAGNMTALDELPALQAGVLFPLLVADRVRDELEGDLA